MLGRALPSRYILKLPESSSDQSADVLPYDVAPKQPVRTAAGTANRDGWRILMAEDNDLNREIARELLQMEGVNVEEAVNGKDAVERFAASAPGYYDAILMDIQMPVMNGYDAAAAIRQSGRGDAATIPIIALTANAFTDDIYRARKAGMNMHLPKPLNVGKLLEALEETIEGKNG